jgi:hypothetical protein
MLIFGFDFSEFEAFGFGGGCKYNMSYRSSGKKMKMQMRS